MPTFTPTIGRGILGITNPWYYLRFLFCHSVGCKLLSFYLICIYLIASIKFSYCYFLLSELPLNVLCSVFYWFLHLFGGCVYECGCVCLWKPFIYFRSVVLNWMRSSRITCRSRAPKDPFRRLIGQHCFHSNSKTFFAIFTVLTFTVKPQNNGVSNSWCLRTNQDSSTKPY